MRGGTKLSLRSPITSLTLFPKNTLSQKDTHTLKHTWAAMEKITALVIQLHLKQKSKQFWLETPA